MFATAIWLVWVAAVQTGPGGVLAALVAILAAGFLVWLLGLARGGGLRSRLASATAALLVALGAGAFVLQSAVPLATGAARASDSGIWSPERVAELQAQGKPVFVNFTAAWCITCIANERVALSREEVTTAFGARGVVSLKADWTNRDATIAKALAEHGRAGVPLYLFYPGARGAPAEILPQLLTPDMLVAAADRASGNRTAASRP
jgi:thiol:disulfide interchange protein DsbD